MNSSRYCWEVRDKSLQHRCARPFWFWQWLFDFFVDFFSWLFDFFSRLFQNAYVTFIVIYLSLKIIWKFDTQTFLWLFESFVWVGSPKLIWRRWNIYGGECKTDNCRIISDTYLSSTKFLLPSVHYKNLFKFRKMFMFFKHFKLC